MYRYRVIRPFKRRRRLQFILHLHNFDLCHEVSAHPIMALSRSEIIQANPIGNRLQDFRGSFLSTHPGWSPDTFDPDTFDPAAQGKVKAVDHFIL